LHQSNHVAVPVVGLPLLTALVLLAVLAGCSKQNPSTSFMLKVPPLIPQGKLIESVARWDGRVVVVTDEYGNGEPRLSHRVFVVDAIAGALVPLRLGKGMTPVSVAENATACFAVCRRGTQQVLLTKNKQGAAGWVESELDFVIASGESVRLAAGYDRLLLVTETSLYERSRTKSWVKWSLKDVLGKDLEDWRILPSAILATDDGVIIGYNRGEWGGAAYAVSFPATGQSPTSEKIVQFPVRSIVQEVDGKIWIAGGLSHMGGQMAWLYQYSDGRIRPIIRQEDAGTDERSVAVSSDALWHWETATEISGATVGSDGKLLVVAARLGVFEVNRNGMKQLIKADFFTSYREERTSVGSFPHGIATDTGDNIYVATRSLGVLAFRRQDEGFLLKQIGFGKPGG